MQACQEPKAYKCWDSFLWIYDLMWLFLKSSCWRMKSNMWFWIPRSTPPISSDRKLAVINRESAIYHNHLAESKYMFLRNLKDLFVNGGSNRLPDVQTDCVTEELPSETALTHVRVWLASGLWLLHGCHQPIRIPPKILGIYIFKIRITNHISLVLSLLWKVFPI